MTSISTPTPVEGPVMRSVDIDLSTPAPARRARAAGGPRASKPWVIEGGPVMNRPATHQPRLSPSRLSSSQLSPSQLAPSQLAPLRLPGQPPSVSSSPMHPLATGRPYTIRPTPTFSFTEELESARREQQRRGQRGQRRTGAGGGALLLVLMLLAGSAGYVAVKYRVWQDTGPLVERAKELAQSLRTLSPMASPDTLPRPARAVPAAAAIPNPRLAPEVVPITRDPEPAATKRNATPNARPTAATIPARAPEARHHATAAHHQRAEKSAARKMSDTDADPTEEELLAPSANRR